MLNYNFAQFCLGTAQFGMDYGIRGQKRPSLSDALAMFDYAAHNGINTIDTANAYGDAEDVIGAWLSRDTSIRGKTNLISKLKPNLLDDVSVSNYYAVMKQNLEQSLNRLHTDYLDGYLLHSARYVFEDEIIDTLVRLKKEGYVKKVGVSVYEVAEAVKGIETGALDFLQLPYSIFDQRMLHGNVFELAKQKGFTLHSRSAFIQGLILMSENEIPGFLQKAKPIIRQIDAFCKESGLSRIQIAMGYVKQERVISHLVFGVDNMEQLKEDIALFHQDVSADLIGDIAKQFSQLDADIVMPSLWTK